MYDSGSSSQCSVRAERGGMRWEVGGRFKKEGTHVYLWLMHVNICRNQHDIVKHLSFN